jgi:inward rectifier potassium channel
MDEAPYGRRRGVFRFGDTHVKRVGGARWHWGDSYHWVLTLSWPRFLWTVLAVYMGTNLLFALAYFLVPGAVANARPDSFLDVFFFSIETLATVGYGYMNPATPYGHVVASCEILIGMLEVAVVTGLLFARFSRPTSRILFSNVVVITKFNGTPTLMLRTGNERNNLILEASVRASIMRRERTAEGQVYTRFYDLHLERQHTSVFALSWTIMHKIDAHSPLFGKNADDLLAEGATLTVSISGMDDTLNDFVHARHTYQPDAFYFSYHFVDILSKIKSEDEGEVSVINFDRFHDILID